MIFNASIPGGKGPKRPKAAAFFYGDDMLFLRMRTLSKLRRASVVFSGAAALAWALCPGAASAAEGDVTIPMSVGVPVYVYHVASGQTTTVAINPGDKSSDNSLKISEFPGIGYYVTNQIRLG